MKLASASALLLTAGIVALAGCSAAQRESAVSTAAAVGETARSVASQICVPQQTAFVDMTPNSPQCTQCKFTLLPGAAEPSPVTRYSIHSDLPEVLLTNGVAYSTTPKLVPFKLHDGTPVKDEMLVQHNRGFETIDGDFEVFIFHIARPGDGSQPRRMVVYAKNTGEAPVNVEGRQIMITDGIIGTVHEMESNLGRRVLAEEWDRPVGEVTIAPGEGKVVAYSKIFSTLKNDADNSANINCFGQVRADVESAKEGVKPSLDVYIISIPGTDAAKNDELAASLLTTGAQSGETYIDLNTEPTGCQLRRTCGVFESFVWRNKPVVLDASKLAADGRRFQMAVPEIQSTDCPDAKQTVPLVLHQRTNRPDTVGNYMIEYRVQFHLVNSDPVSPKTFDFVFGKEDADIGLAWQVAMGDDAIPSDETVDRQPVRTGWAGPKQKEMMQRSFLTEDGGTITLAPCEERYVAARFMILGNSSLPFQIGFRPAP